MTDDSLTDRLSEQLRELPLLDAPAEISDRVAAEIRREPRSADVSAQLASLETMSAPEQLTDGLGDALSGQRPPSGIRSRLRPLTRRFSAAGWRPGVLIAGLAVGGLLVGVAAVSVISRIAGSGSEVAYVVQRQFTFYPQQHDEPTGLARMTIHVKATPEGTVWRAEAVAIDGTAVTPTCAGSGAAPVTGATGGAVTPPPPTTLQGGSSIQCSADVGAAAPITGAMAVVVAPGSDGTTVSVTTTTPTTTTTGTTSSGSTTATQSSSSPTTTTSPPATTAGP